MRVLHVTADWKWTGPAEPMLHAVTGLRALGHEADLACPGPPNDAMTSLLARAHERGVEPALLLDRARGVRPLADRAEVARLRALARDYDVVHVHHSRDHVLLRRALGGAADRARTTRLVASWHHGEPIPPRPWNRWLYGRSGCDGLVLLAERLDLPRPGRPAAAVAGSVDTDRFAPRTRDPELRRALGLAPEARVIGVVARLQPHRRFDLLLEAFARARAEAPGLRGLVVGRGTRARAVLEEPRARLGLDDVVLRAGYRAKDYVEVLAQLDALVFLVPGSDGSCRAVLEAMALEIPIVASRRGVLPDTVVDGETGRLVDESPEALTEAFVDVWRDPAAWRARGKAARRRAIAEHAIDTQARRLERFYASLVGSASSSSTSSR